MMQQNQLSNLESLLRTCLIWPAVMMFFFACLVCASAENLGKHTDSSTTDEDPHYVWQSNDWGAFHAKWYALAGEGLRLVDLELSEEDGEVRYSGIWSEGEDDHYLWRSDNWNEFAATTQELTSQSLRLIDVEISVENGGLQYVGVWREGEGPYSLWTCPSWDVFVERSKSLSMRGLGLIDFEARHYDGNTLFFGLYRPGQGDYVLMKDKQWTKFAAGAKELADKELMPVDIEHIHEDGESMFVGVFGHHLDAQYSRHADSDIFVNEWEALSAQRTHTINFELSVDRGTKVEKRAQDAK